MNIFALLILLIIQTNQLKACDYCCACPPVFGNNQPIPKSPYLYQSAMSSEQPYGYENSDLKKIYLSGYDCTDNW